jgi:UDP-N-acetylmuramate--alanine ligase
MTKPDIPQGSRIHLVGIGGTGVGPIAVILANMGFRVSGSDLRMTLEMERLKSKGVEVYCGHSGENIKDDVDLVVTSAAVPDDNPELVAARLKGIPIWSRAQMLGWLMSDKVGIAVAGTHGKTTTTSMLGMVLEAIGLDPTVYAGGSSDALDVGARVGKGKLFVAEACEAFNSFLELRPKIAVVTNIEADHLDFHGSLEGVIQSFKQFLSRIENDGHAVLCVDCPNVRRIAPYVQAHVVSYGFDEAATCRAYDIDISAYQPRFKVWLNGRDLGDFRLCVPGIHNVKNALAVIAVVDVLGIDPAAIREALSRFRGVGRRFEVLGMSRGITVVDDYAHHPTEVAATISAARSFNRRVIAVFQPHLYSRTQYFAPEFARSLGLADLVYVSEIYAAREKPIPGVSGAMIVDMVNENEPGKAKFVPAKEQLPEELLSILKPEDLVLIMGAGDIRSVGETLLERLKN